MKNPNYASRISEETIDALKRISPESLINHGIIKTAPNFSERYQRGYICPFCHSGTGHNHNGRGDGAGTFDADNQFYCHACNNVDNGGKKYSTIDLFMHARNISEFKEACRQMAMEFHIDVSFEDSPAMEPKKEKSADELFDAAQISFIQADIAEAQKHLDALPESQRRGLTIETMRHFKFGFIEEWVSPKIRAEAKLGTYVNKDGTPRKLPPPTCRIIIPTDALNHYNAVALPDDRATIDKQFWKMHTVNISLFNAAALNAEMIIAVEGEIDVASIWQASGGTVAVVGVIGGNARYLIDALKKENVTGKKIVIIFDNDSGQKHAENLRGELVKIGVPAVNKIFDDFISAEDKAIVGGKIDANAILVKLGADKLKSYTESILTAAQVDFAAVEEKIAREAALTKRLDEWQEREGKINPETLGKLKTALNALDALTPETFTVADVDKHKHNAALALTYNLRDAAEKYFKTIKAAKEIARNRIRESDSDLTKKLSDDELNALTALAEGVDIKTLRRDVDREVTALDKAHKDFIKAENARIAKEKYAKAKEIRAIEITNAEERFKQLKAMEPSKERDAELVDVIRQLCEWKHNKFGEPVAVAGTQANAALIFDNDPDLDELFGFDEFAQADVFLKPAPWKKKAQKGDEWTDRDDAQLRLLIRDRYTEFANKELIADNVTKFADAHAFHEVKEYFKSLPPWDKKPRAETLFIDWLKVDDTPFVREVTMKILMAAVERIYYPGCTFQNAVIIHGNQKIGKGYILERLGGKWYKAITDHVDDHHAVDAIRICWIGEFKEMASMRKADVNAIKEFIELSADTRRFAYARRATTVPRHCVFFITVNDDQFLADMTGNRRFWILHSPLPKFGYVKEVRGERLSDDNVIAQIWAEVLQHCKELFKDGFDEKKLVLSTEAEFKGEEIAEQYLRDDGLQGEIQSFLDDTKILPPVIWDLLSKEQRRQFFADNGVFAIEEEELAAKFKASRKIIPPELQAEFDAAIKPCDFVHRSCMRDKKTGEVTTYLKFIGNVYRQHICAAEIRAECFDKSDRRAAPQRINEILARLDGWSLGKRIQKDPAYGDQKKVYCRNADNVPADDDEPTDNQPVAEPTTDDLHGEPIPADVATPEQDFDLSQYDD